MINFIFAESTFILSYYKSQSNLGAIMLVETGYRFTDCNLHVTEQFKSNETNVSRQLMKIAIFYIT